MSILKCYIPENDLYYKEISYILNLYCRQQKLQLLISPDKNDCDLKFSEQDGSGIPVNASFYKSLAGGNYDLIHHFNTGQYILHENGRPDYLSTAFYLINSIQEFNSENRDELGRFIYTGSYQDKFNCVEDNIVQLCFDKFSEEINSSGSRTGVVKSGFFLTHDIDTIYGAIFQDGMYAIKKGRFDVLLRLLMNVVLLKPDWMNIDQIMRIEDDYSFKSTFYWLVRKGRINKREVNSDYDFKSASVNKMVNTVSERGWENGIHKSISGNTFSEEISDLNFNPGGNRYHYLKFSLPQAYNEIERSGIPLDTSLGFHEKPGFRNSYGLPFRPFNISEKITYNFIEVPLNIMDQTYFRYLKLNPSEISDHVIRFLEKNSENSIITILWHNNFFSDYKFKGFMQAYKKILRYLYEKEFRCYTQSELIKEFKET